eukprot:11146748-Alexandrium_andersonii.AAC.1
MASRRGRLRMTSGRRVISRALQSLPPLLSVPAKRVVLRLRAAGRGPRARAANKRSAVDKQSAEFASIGTMA